MEKSWYPTREDIDKVRLSLAIRDRLQYLSLEELQQINTIAVGQPTEVPLPEGVASLEESRKRYEAEIALSQPHNTPSKSRELSRRRKH